jgi:integrase
MRLTWLTRLTGPSTTGVSWLRRSAGLCADWVPRELRHTFVSLLSSDGVPLEDIADLVGHKGTMTTETVYRKVIVPELRRGAEVMDRLFR